MGVGLFASPAYLRARGRLRAASSLAGHDVLLPSGELSRLPEAKWLASRPGVRAVFRSNCMPALVAAAVAGLGIVPLALGWGHAEPALEQVLALDHLAKRRLFLVMPEVAAARPAVRAVATHLASTLTRIFGA